MLIDYCITNRKNVSIFLSYLRVVISQLYKRTAYLADKSMAKFADRGSSGSQIDTKSDRRKMVSCFLETTGRIEGNDNDMDKYFSETEIYLSYNLDSI